MWLYAVLAVMWLGYSWLLFVYPTRVGKIDSRVDSPRLETTVADETDELIKRIDRELTQGE